MKITIEPKELHYGTIRLETINEIRALLCVCYTAKRHGVPTAPSTKLASQIVKEFDKV